MTAFIRRDEPVLIWTGRAMLDAVLSVPQNASGMVVIAGVSGTFHHDRMRSIARRFQDHDLATLIADLLTADEQPFDARTGHFRVDTPFLATRVADIVTWVRSDARLEDLPVALFAGTSAAAACIEAADGLDLFALALIGPKYDAIRAHLAAVGTPTLIVFDEPPTQAQLGDMVAGPPVSSVVTVPGISSLLLNDDVADVAAREALKWFGEHRPAAGTV